MIDGGGDDAARFGVAGEQRVEAVEQAGNGERDDEPGEHRQPADRRDRSSCAPSARSGGRASPATWRGADKGRHGERDDGGDSTDDEVVTGPRHSRRSYEWTLTPMCDLVDMNDADRALAELAATQRQVFTRMQAYALGLTPSDVSYRIARGLLVRIGPHTVRFAGASRDYWGQLLAGLLDLGSPALVAGRAAAAAAPARMGSTKVRSSISVPRSMRNRRTPGLVMSTPAIEPLDRVVVDGLPTCSPTLTIVQLLGAPRRSKLAMLWTAPPGAG